MSESDKAILQEPLEYFDHKESCQIQHSIKILKPFVKICVKAAHLLGKKIKKICQLLTIQDKNINGTSNHY